MSYIYITVFVECCRENCSAIFSKKLSMSVPPPKKDIRNGVCVIIIIIFLALITFFLLKFPLISLHDNKPVYRLQQQSIRRLAFVPPYSVFCSISFRCGGLSIERNQKPLAPEITLALTHHDRQKQVEVKRSSRVNPHEIRLFSGCPYYFTFPIWVQIHCSPPAYGFLCKNDLQRVQYGKPLYKR